MKKFKGILINKSLLTYFMLITLVITLLGFSSYTLFYRNILLNRLTNVVYETNSISSDSFASHFESYFTSNNILVQTMENSLDNFGTSNQAALDEFFTDIDEGTYDYLSFELLDPSGVVYYAYPHNSAVLGIDRSNEEFVEAASDFGALYWSRPYVSLYSDELTISITTKNQDFYVIAYMPLTYINDLYLNNLGENSEKNLMILDQYGIYLYDSKTDNEEIRLPFDKFNDVKNFNINSLHTLVIEDEMSIISVSRIEFTDWYLIVYENSSITQNIIQGITNVLTMFLIALLLLLIVLFYLLFRVFRKQLIELNTGLKEIANGNLTYTFTEKSFQEINDLSFGLNYMRHEISISRDKLEGIAYIDHLTNIPSKVYLKQYFENILNDKGNSFSFIYFDLMRFSIINESYGYMFGDEVIVQVVNRILKSIKDNWKLFRIESDEFLLMSIKSNKEKTMKQIDELEALFYEPLNVRSIDVVIQLIFGVVLTPNEGDNFETLLNHCKKAISSVDSKSDKKVSFYDPSLENEYDRQIKIELSLENALQNDEFTAYYQPIVDINNEDIRGFEALARWIHPILGIVSPGEFIPILEKTHKIHRLDMFIIERSIQETQIISKKFKKDFIVSCNVSVETILRPKFIEFILESLSKYDYPAKYLELEITESTIIYDFEKIRGIMSKLASKGVRFSEDDFGDGYSSLNYLTQLDIQTLKISRTFTKNVFKNEKNKYFIDTILKLANSIGLETVIEGVEDLETLNFYKLTQCDYIQGYYFYKPMPFEKLVEIINEKIMKK